MSPTVRFLVLTEDSGREGLPTVQRLTRAALRLIAPSLDPRRVEVSPLLDNPRVSGALRGNAWKERRPTLAKLQLLGAIATRLVEDGGFVVFHVDSDTVWSRRQQSENRLKFDKIIRAGVLGILTGLAPLHVKSRFVPLSDRNRSCRGGSVALRNAPLLLNRGVALSVDKGVGRDMSICGQIQM